MDKEGVLEPKTGLTGFSEEQPATRGSDIRTLLAEAGLELWQAPEGFWAIRAKPAATSPKPQRRRRARTVG